MSIKKGNKLLSVVLTPYHHQKLQILCNRSGLSKTQVVQRLIEDAKVFKDEREMLRERDGIVE